MMASTPANQGFDLLVLLLSITVCNNFDELNAKLVQGAVHGSLVLNPHLGLDRVHGNTDDDFVVAFSKDLTCEQCDQ